ncbi:MAG: DUF1549 domain-containing protein [Pirellulales bacterium]
MPLSLNRRRFGGLPRIVSVLLSAYFAAGVSSAESAEPAAPQKAARVQAEFFETHIRPVLVEQCIACHGPQKQESGLRLDSREALFKGGAEGAAVVAGRPEESLLIEAIRHEGLEMPPEQKLDDAVIANFETWVRSGAQWPAGDAPSAPALGDQVAIFAKAPSHWAFQPVNKPESPTVQDAAWSRNSIDRFVLAKLEAAGLKPSREAEAAVLCRRLYFDLIGLPPSPAEVDDFVKSYTSPDRAAAERAYAQLIDKLLASKHYGERWGRHWLDVARYADTRDFVAAGVDRRYPYAFTYRDWVVNAFNRDLPYDEFIREQLAADFYADDKQSPSLAALGLLTVGPRFGNDQAEQIADRIDVVTRGFLGLAVTCARCHDHKYDPIPTADYYSLYGVFASCEEPTEMPLLSGMIPPKDLLADYEQARSAKVKELDDYAAGLRDTAEQDLVKRIDEYLLGFYEMHVTKEESIRGLISKRKLMETAMTPLGLNLDAARKQAQWRRDPVLGPLFHLLQVVDNNFAGHLTKITKTGKVGDAKPAEVNPVVLEMLRKLPPKDKRALVVAYGKLLKDSQTAERKSDANWEAVRAGLLDGSRAVCVGAEGLSRGFAVIGNRAHDAGQAGERDQGRRHHAPRRSGAGVRRQRQSEAG